jgi:hypothetical protein
MPLRALRSVSATHLRVRQYFGTSRRPNRAPRGCLARQVQAPMRGGNKGAPLWSNASTRRREREEARVGEREQSPSHARVSERRKALAVLPAVPPFAGRQKKRTSGRRVGPSRESPTLERGAAATTSARALSRRGAHACVSPSLGASRPVATQLESLRGDPGRSEVRERGNSLVKKRRLARSGRVPGHF